MKQQLSKCLQAAERAHAARPRRQPDPHPFDPTRLTAQEMDELNALLRPLPRKANGHPDISFLAEEDFDRAASLTYRGRGLVWEDVR